MTNIIDINARLLNHKQRMQQAVQQAETNKMLALAEAIRGQINYHHQVDNCTTYTVIAALTANLAAVVAKLDPTLEKLHMREIIHEHLDKMIDEELIQMWQRGEVDLS